MSSRKTVSLVFVIATLLALLFVSGCRRLPDYEVTRLQVSAYTGSGGRTSHWDILLNVRNRGGTEGIVGNGDTTTPIPQEIPILVTAMFSENRPSGCLSQYSGFARLEKQLWVPVLTTGANQYGFQDVFQIPDLVNHDCVPEDISVQFDLLLPGYTSTIDELDEFGNIISVYITDWPRTHIWTQEAD